jgi:hypothetical protein
MRLALLQLAVVVAAAAAGVTTAMAVAQPAPVDRSVPITDDMPLADYLALLAQIAPPARDGAQAYLHAFQQRCGRQMKTAELRRAMSEGDGDPVLMGMIRASHLGDSNGIAQLGQRVVCDPRAGR